MLVASPLNPVQNNVHQAIRLFRHSKRSEWGLAALMWEHDGKRGYRFDDGTERVFKEGFYHLFESAPTVGDAAEKLLAAVHRERVEQAEARGSADALPVRGPSLPELVAVLREEYPEGLADASWASKRRGAGVKRRAKRHRDAAIHDAAAMLGREALDELLEGDRVEVIVQRFVDVLGATDLVTSKQLEVLRRATPTRALGRALRDLVHEPDPEGERFDAVLRLLARSPGGRPSWSLMTAMRAVVSPHDDVCIRPSVFFDALRVVSPSQAKKVSPQGGQYNRLAALARELCDRLREAGEEARDLLDVYDFIWETRRPAAEPVLARVRQRMAMAPETAPAPGAADADGGEPAAEAA